MKIDSQVEKVRLVILRGALSLELLGMRMGGRATAYSTIKREFGLKGGKKKVYEQFDAYCVTQGCLSKPLPVFSDKRQNHV